MPPYSSMLVTQTILSAIYADFSLTIMHTTQRDAGTDWHCRVIVDNPQTSYTDDWILRVTASHWLFTVSILFMKYSEMFHSCTPT